MQNVEFYFNVLIGQNSSTNDNSFDKIIKSLIFPQILVPDSTGVPNIEN